MIEYNAIMDALTAFAMGVLACGIYFGWMHILLTPAVREKLGSWSKIFKVLIAVGSASMCTGMYFSRAAGYQSEYPERFMVIGFCIFVFTGLLHGLLSPKEKSNKACNNFGNGDQSCS